MNITYEELLHALEEFRQEMLRCKDGRDLLAPDDVKYQCGNVSFRFRDLYPSATVVWMIGATPGYVRTDYYDPQNWRTFFHGIVKYGDWYVDCTYRQIDPEYPTYYRIHTKEELGELYGDISSKIQDTFTFYIRRGSLRIPTHTTNFFVAAQRPSVSATT